MSSSAEFVFFYSVCVLDWLPAVILLDILLGCAEELIIYIYKTKDNFFFYR